MKESRIIDAIVDELLFGKKRVHLDRIDADGCPEYSTDPAEASRIIDAVRQKGGNVKFGMTERTKRWWCEIFGSKLIAAMPICETHEEALCYAVIGSHGMYWLATQSIKRFGDG